MLTLVLNLGVDWAGRELGQESGVWAGWFVTWIGFGVGNNIRSVWFFSYKRQGPKMYLSENDGPDSYYSQSTHKGPNLP